MTIRIGLLPILAPVVFLPLAACDLDAGIALEEAITGEPSLLRTTPRVEFAAPVVAALEVEPVAVLAPEPPAPEAYEYCWEWKWRNTIQTSCETRYR